MKQSTAIRESVLRSLSAVGDSREARFYADLFSQQAPERFALIVIDPRCLKDPLLEALIADIRILADIGLVPTLLVGALDDDRTSVRFQTMRLSKELESVSVKAARLNTATYGLLPDIRKTAAAGRLTILELTEAGERYGLKSLVRQIQPDKVIFLQPSGGISHKGERVPVLKINETQDTELFDPLSEGQQRFLTIAADLAADPDLQSVYVIASPLNLLTELFTVKGAGTLIRKAAQINCFSPPDLLLDRDRLRMSIETAFGKSLKPNFPSEPFGPVFIDADYRGGALMTRLAGLPYLSKFWVSREARGEGISRDIWDRLCADVPSFFWRSRRANPFNEWYMKTCDGMQITGDWRVFWKNLSAPEIPGVIIAAGSAGDDFEPTDLS